MGLKETKRWPGRDEVMDAYLERKPVGSCMQDGRMKVGKVGWERE